MTYLTLVDASVSGSDVSDDENPILLVIATFFFTDQLKPIILENPELSLMNGARYRCQFHQYFMRSFHTCRSQKCKMTLLSWLIFYAFRVCTRQSCFYNIDEIHPKSLVSFCTLGIWARKLVKLTTGFSTKRWFSQKVFVTCVNILFPWVKICQSRRRTHDNWKTKQTNTMILTLVRYKKVCHGLWLLKQDDCDCFRVNLDHFYIEHCF